MKTLLEEERNAVSPVQEEPEVKFYWWLLTTNFLHLLVYAVAVRRGDEFLYMEDHCMISRCVQNQNNAGC